MDEIDQAQGYNDDFQAFALEQQRKSREQNNSAAADCVDCEEPIPTARRQAIPGCLRCVSCQQEHEILLHWRA